MVSPVGLRGVTAFVVTFLLVSSVPVNADDARVEERPYVATPGLDLVNMPGVVAAFELRESDSSIHVSVDDALAEYTEAAVYFSSETYPFARAVTFCRSVTLSVPWWADVARVYVERVNDGIGSDPNNDPQANLRELLEGPGGVVEETPIGGTPAGQAVADKVDNPPHLVPDIPYEGESTCPYSGHAATVGIITARIS